MQRQQTLARINTHTHRFTDTHTITDHSFGDNPSGGDKNKGMEIDITMATRRFTFLSSRVVEESIHIIHFNVPGRPRRFPVGKSHFVVDPDASKTEWHHPHFLNKTSFEKGVERGTVIIQCFWLADSWFQVSRVNASVGKTFKESRHHSQNYTALKHVDTHKWLHTPQSQMQF